MKRTKIIKKDNLYSLDSNSTQAKCRNITIAPNGKDCFGTTQKNKPVLFTYSDEKGYEAHLYDSYDQLIINNNFLISYTDFIPSCTLYAPNGNIYPLGHRDVSLIITDCYQIDGDIYLKLRNHREKKDYLIKVSKETTYDPLFGNVHLINGVYPFNYLNSKRKLCTYDKINRVDDYFIVSQNGKLGIIDEQGNIILPINYTNISKVQSSHQNVFEAHDTLGNYIYFYALTGKIINKGLNSYHELEEYLTFTDTQNYNSIPYLTKVLEKYFLEHNLSNLLEYLLNQNLQTLQSVYARLPYVDKVLNFIKQIDSYLSYFTVIDLLPEDIKYPLSEKDELFQILKEYKTISLNLDTTRKNQNISNLINFLKTKKNELLNLINTIFTSNQIKVITDSGLDLNFRLSFHPLLANLSNDIENYRLDIIAASYDDQTKEIASDRLQQANLIISTNKDLITQIEELIHRFKDSGLDFTSVIEKISSLKQINIYDNNKPFLDNMHNLNNLTIELTKLSAYLDSLLSPYKEIFPIENDKVKK